MAETGAPWPAAVGVSGGGDSLALMSLLRDWARASKLPPPVVLCVDHGLRPESRSEARTVMTWAKAAGLRGWVLAHKGKVPHSDVEAAARQARYRLMGDWAKRNDIKAIYVAHTRDDQAETFLLRLARGSGVDGLSAMRPMAPYPDADYRELKLIRPLLGFDRQELRDYLASQGQTWLDDPMNDDRRFKRVQIRNAWPALEAAGLTKQRIADAALHLGRARAALDAVSEAVLLRACRLDGNKALLDPRALTAAPREIGLRALASVLMIVSRAAYRPRFERLEALFDAIRTDSVGAGRTLHGCRIAPAPRRLAARGSGLLLVDAEERPRNTGKRQPEAAKQAFNVIRP
jgi:tRNA(Ile)-lysidine synthase